MGESLMERRRVEEEVFRYVNSFSRRRSQCMAQGNSKREYRNLKQISMFKILNSKHEFGKLEF